MISFATTTVFGVDWIFLKPYIVLGLALGGVYALSGVGVVVLYQATGVLNLAFGAIGAAGTSTVTALPPRPLRRMDLAARGCRWCCWRSRSSW